MQPVIKHIQNSQYMSLVSNSGFFIAQPNTDCFYH